MLLEVRNLRIAFRRGGHETVPVRDVSFAVPEHGRVAIVGESGCGKSLTALSLLRLPPTDRAYISGTATFTGKRISYVFQNPSDSLNPVMRISAQIREALPKGMSKSAAEAKVVELLARTGLPDPARAARAYPCELSGGQQQRAMIAMALAAAPDLLVADEPTTALDVTTQKQVLELIDSLAAETGMAVLLITHNLGLVSHTRAIPTRAACSRRCRRLTHHVTRRLRTSPARCPLPTSGRPAAPSRRVARTRTNAAMPRCLLQQHSARFATPVSINLP